MDDAANSYVVDNTLVIILSDDQIKNGYALNLTTQRTYASPDWHQCIAISNDTAINCHQPCSFSTIINKNVKSDKV